MTVYYGTYYGYTLEHHGVKGMKWGVRRYQNEDGSLTDAGRARYGYDIAKAEYKKARKDLRRSSFGFKGLKQRGEAKKKFEEAEFNLVKAKGKKSGTDKGEFKEYRKFAERKGMPNSMYDDQTGGAATRFYDRLAKEKGKAYADEVFSSASRRLATKAAVGLGISFVATMMSLSVDNYY